MMCTPFQVGYFIDFHPLLGPAALTIGMNFLLLWFVEEHLLSIYFEENHSSPTHRLFISVLFTSGLFLTTAAYLVQMKSVWTLAFILLLCGKIIECAILIITIDK